MGGRSMKLQASLKRAFLIGVIATSLQVCVTNTQAASGTWTLNGTSTWSTGTNWLDGIVADGVGSTADFNTINISGNRTVNLDSPRTIGNLIFGDTTTTNHGW